MTGLDSIVKRSAEKLQAFRSKQIVADNREMWELWEAVRVLAINLRENNQPKTGARARNGKTNSAKAAAAAPYSLQITRGKNERRLRSLPLLPMHRRARLPSMVVSGLIARTRFAPAALRIMRISWLRNSDWC